MSSFNNILYLAQVDSVLGSMIRFCYKRVSLLSSTSEGIKLEISSMHYFSTAVRVEQHNHTSQNHNYDGHQAWDVSSGTNIGDRTTGQ